MATAGMGHLVVEADAVAVPGQLSLVIIRAARRGMVRTPVAAPRRSRPTEAERYHHDGDENGRLVGRRNYLDAAACDARPHGAPRLALDVRRGTLSSGGVAPLVAVMEPAHPWQRDNLRGRRWSRRDRPGFRRVLGEAEMGPVRVIASEVPSNSAWQNAVTCRIRYLRALHLAGRAV